MHAHRLCEGALREPRPLLQELVPLRPLAFLLAGMGCGGEPTWTRGLEAAPQTWTRDGRWPPGMTELPSQSQTAYIWMLAREKAIIYVLVQTSAIVSVVAAKPTASATADTGRLVLVS